MKMLHLMFRLGLLLCLSAGFSPVNALAADSATNTTTNATTTVAKPVAPLEPLSDPRLTFGLDRVDWLQAKLLGNPSWQYVAALIYIFLAFCATKLLDYLLQAQLGRLAARTKTQADDLMIKLIRGPIKIVVFVIFLYIGLRFFSWPAWAQSFIANGTKIIIAAVITYLILKVVDLVMGLWQQKIAASGEGMLDMELFPIMRKTIKVFVVIVAFLVTSQNLGMNVTGLLASLSIGGLAVGLAAQDTLSNLFGAVALLADKPFRVGDRIQLDTIDGTVEAIGLRSTRIRNLDGHLVTLPNRTMANANLTNITLRPTIKTILNLGLTYDTPAEKIERSMKILEEILRSNPKTSDLLITFNRFDNSALNIQVVHWWNGTDGKENVLALQKINLDIKRRFDAEQISFAFPSQTVYLRQDSDWRLAGGAERLKAEG